MGRKRAGDLMPENLTIESLARAIHEDHVKACLTVSGVPPQLHLGCNQCPNFDDLPKWTQETRREQARLMFLRIMR
jgi:hypothetical protein